MLCAFLLSAKVSALHVAKSVSSAAFAAINPSVTTVQKAASGPVTTAKPGMSYKPVKIKAAAVNILRSGLRISEPKPWKNI